MRTEYWKLDENDGNTEILQQAAALIQRGEVVAFPTETVYGLGADGLNPEAVAKIFAAKGRPNDNPLILHIANKRDIRPLTTGLNANAKILIDRFWPGPLTLVVPKSDIVPDAVSAGLDTVAVRYPKSKLARSFIKACGCPIAAPSANISGRPSPTNAEDVLEDMQGKIAAVLDGGSCGIGLESTVVDTTGPVPTILRPGGITYEMLLKVLGEVEIDPALTGDKNFRPKAPGMKYRHYAPQAPMYLFEGKARNELSWIIAEAYAKGLKLGVLCSARLADTIPESYEIDVCVWGQNKRELANDLFAYLRYFDRLQPDIILAEGVDEVGLGLAIMNRMRKAAGYQIVTLEKDGLHLKNSPTLPDFMVQ